MTKGSSQITTTGLDYLSREKPFSNQECQYILNVSRNGDLSYIVNSTWADFDDIIFDVGAFIQDLFFFVHYSSLWVRQISRLYSLAGMKELSVTLDIPQSCILAAPIDLVGGAIHHPKKISTNMLEANIALKPLEYIHFVDISCVCSELLNPIISEFSYEFNRQARFLSLDEEVLEQRIAQLIKMIGRKESLRSI